jgi:hypothetical protein
MALDGRIAQAFSAAAILRTWHYLNRDGQA